MKNILLLGANSDMARALARRLASPDTRFLLAGRSIPLLEANAADLEIRGGCPKSLIFGFDARALEQHPAFAREVAAQAGFLDQVYLFFGHMQDQAAAQSDFQRAREMLETNYLGAVSILERIAEIMEKQGKGLIVGVSSVAGDRGRQSNYFYGSAKAGLSAYLSGLRNRMYKSGVQVMTVKPGFVDTAMTRSLKKGILFAKPDAIARGIVRGIRKKKDTVYLPGFWKWIMLIIRLIPERVFKRMSL